MKRTPYHSFTSGYLAKGCRQCVKGRKLVLFVTGICASNCFYCPISDQKKGQDVVYANEWPNPTFQDILTEARLTEAQGAGITGGDPLCALNRTTKMIRGLKKEFGKEFHTHLYTPLKLVTREALTSLYKAGLDEIRFHPDLFKREEWKRLDLASEFDWDIGVEIPAIPLYPKETKKLIDAIVGKVSFLNINELEYSDSNSQDFGKRKLIVKNYISYGIEGSEEMAIDMIRYVEKKEYPLRVHFCTAKLKDAVQLSNRIKIRARNVKKPYDKVTPAGTLTRGVIYPLDGEDPKTLAEQIAKRFRVKKDWIAAEKTRVLIREKEARKISKKIPNKCSIVEEYPTYDRLKVEEQPLQ